MLTKILEFHHSVQSLNSPSQSTLYIPNDTYQDYLAFLFQNNQQMNVDNHVIYLQKMVFDTCLESFLDEELMLLQEKEDLYLYYIMHSTFKNMDLVSQQQFNQYLEEMDNYFNPTSDEQLFLQKIQSIVKSTLQYRTTPFSYLELCKDLFSDKLKLKLIDILKYMIGDSLCFMMPPAKIFGICLKWTITRYGIDNKMINQLIGHFVDKDHPETQEKIEKLTEIMNQIMNMDSGQ